ncbi:zonular occludens toxin domain-containing protein, partial [Acinetobacter sp. ULE_I057]|uniref:zonular occludens toxin domain-containing protein n=1 Tax=Acinetobacter sp. ULE_I057 TaxID=3373070 RepID=UPI003AF6EE62
SFLPNTFKVIPDSDWTLINQSAYIIYDGCEYLYYFTALSKLTDHRLQALLTHRHLGHDIVFIFQHEKFAHPLIREVSELVYLHDHYYSRRSFSDL